jgi:hypothetical protein
MFQGHFTGMMPLSLSSTLFRMRYEKGPLLTASSASLGQFINRSPLQAPASIPSGAVKALNYWSFEISSVFACLDVSDFD